MTKPLYDVKSDSLAQTGFGYSLEIINTITINQAEVLEKALIAPFSTNCPQLLYLQVVLNHDRLLM